MVTIGKQKRHIATPKNAAYALQLANQFLEKADS